jgi:hypothetical protein
MGRVSDKYQRLLARFRADPHRNDTPAERQAAWRKRCARGGRNSARAKKQQAKAARKAAVEAERERKRLEKEELKWLFAECRRILGQKSPGRPKKNSRRS